MNASAGRDVDRPPGQLVALLRPEVVARRRPAGWWDTTDAPVTPAGGVIPRLMLDGPVPAVYERWWRPAWSRVLLGPRAGGIDGEVRLVREALGAGPGDTVVDLGSGTGRFTRALGADVGPRGLALGIDASPAMLDRAARARGGALHLRADASHLPLRDAVVDALCCFAALHLMPRPGAALDEIARVLRPGGRVVLLTTRRLAPGPLRGLEDLVGRLGGLRVIEPDELRADLERRGMVDVRPCPTGVALVTTARRG